MSARRRFRYPVAADGMKDYMARPGAMPKEKIEATIPDEEALGIVREFMGAEWKKLTRKAMGGLKHDFLVPGGWYNNFWDWDSFFVSCAIPEEGLQYAKGSIMNLLDGVREDGRPPKQASHEGQFMYDNLHPYPLHAQFCHIVAGRMGDYDWIEPLWPRLVRVTRWYEKETMTPQGYFAWLSFEGNGIDNNPAVYGRPPRTSAGVDLAVWHHREYRALARLADKLGKPEKDEFAGKALELGRRISEDYWDHVDRMFYNLDLSWQEAGWRQKVKWRYYLKFRNWASLFPLWGGEATKPQARRLAGLVMDNDEFLSCAGVRSHSACDPVYNNEPMGGPSNWQGPVWGLSTFVTAYGLARYGFRDEALDVANRLIRTFAADIRKNGCVHEFYHGDTGQPVMKPGFLCWNLLAMRVVDDINSGTDSTTLDL